METTLEVQAPGLVAAAQRLGAAAAQLAAPDLAMHPPLAPDNTSVAAAARLSAAAQALQSAAAAQAAALTATAHQLCAIAARFTEQETLNATTVRTVTAAPQSVGTSDPLAPVPPLPADVRPALLPPLEADGEAVARQLWAGTASAGVDFTQSWRRRSGVADATGDVVRDVASALPELWNSPVSTAATASRLQQQADAIATVAARAAALADQADRHACGYLSAVANTPKPSEFEEVREQLNQALEANALSPGRYAPLVSSLIAKQGELRQQALNTQSQYHEQTATRTGPGQFAAQLPGMVPGLLGAVGGMFGGAIAAAAQVPQALMQSLSGLTTPVASEIDSAAKRFDAHREPGESSGPADAGATVPAGSTGSTPVSPSTSSAPPPPTSLPRGAVSPGVDSPAGPAAMPMGMPMATTAPPAAPGQQIAAEKKVVVPAVAHTESVTGKAGPERLTTGRDVVP